MNVGIYTDSQQEMIYARRAATAWARSGLITEAQLGIVNGRTEHGLSQTNVFFRILFFLFTCIGVVTAVGLYFWFFKVRGSAALAASALFFGAASYAMAEYFVRKKSFYRHGIEEGLALCGLFLVCYGVITAVFPQDYGDRWIMISLLLLFAAAALWLYLRFGYLYAAVLSLVSASGVPFQLDLSPASEKVLLAAALALILLLSIRAERSETRDFARERSAELQAILLAGIYLALNLRLHLLGRLWFGDYGPHHGLYAGYPPWFYWATYGLVFLIPLLGFAYGIRTRKRTMINMSVLAFVLSLATNKDYLGFKHYAWDPVILGVSLIVAAVAITRWLRAGEQGMRRGFTARSLVKPEDHGISLQDIGAAALPGVVGMPQPQAPTERPFEGGQSGGGGAAGNY